MFASTRCVSEARLADGWMGIFAAVSADPGFLYNFLDDGVSGPYLGMVIFGVHEL